MRKLIEIVVKENGRFFAIGTMGASIASFTIVFFLGLVMGIERNLETKILPEASLEVAAERSDIVDTLSLFTGGGKSVTEIS